MNKLKAYRAVIDILYKQHHIRYFKTKKQTY